MLLKWHLGVFNAAVVPLQCKFVLWLPSQKSSRFGILSHGENGASDQLVKYQHTPLKMIHVWSTNAAGRVMYQTLSNTNWANKLLLIDSTREKLIKMPTDRCGYILSSATSRHLMFFTGLRASFMIIITWIKVLSEHNTGEGCLFQVIVVISQGWVLPQFLKDLIKKAL